MTTGTYTPDLNRTLPMRLPYYTLDVFTTHERVFHRVEDVFDTGLRLLLRDALLLHQDVDEVGFQHRIPP